MLEGMRMRLARLKRALAALVTALAVGVLGVSIVAPETAQAAGVVVEHRTYGAPEPSPLPRDEDS